MLPSPAGPLPVPVLRLVGELLTFFAWWNVVWLGHLGVAWVIGGRERMSGRSYQALVAVADYLGISPVAWGWVLIAAAGSLAVGLIVQRTVGFLLRWVGYILGALCAGSLFFLLELQVSRDPLAGATGAPTYLFVTGFQLAMLYASIVTFLIYHHERRERE